MSVMTGRLPFVLLCVAIYPFTAFSASECDTRIAIDNPARHPFNTVATIRFDKTCTHSLKAWGTGALVGPHLVLTAGHVVYNRSEGHKNQTCNYIQPAAYRDEASGTIVYPYGERTISDTKYKKANNKWANASYSPASEVDYGGIHLVCPFEEITTYMPMVFDYGTSFINMSGYPIDDLPLAGRGGEQWRVSGGVTSTTDRKMVYDARSTGGASGAPVWEFRSGSQTRRLIAVNRGHSNSCNGIAARLVWQNEGLINKWLDWRPSLSETIAEGCLRRRAVKMDLSELLARFNKDRRMKLYSPQELRLVMPPRNLRKRSKPDFRVYQVIENQKYVWDEFLTNPKNPKSTRYIRLMQPQRKWLSLKEGQALLSASATWSDQKPSGKYEKRGPVGELVPIPMPMEREPSAAAVNKDNIRDTDLDSERRQPIKGIKPLKRMQ